MSDRTYPRFTVTAKAEKALRSGHPWVYGEEITERSGDHKNGDIVDVFSKKGSWLGSGFVNDNSKIAIRIISKNTNDRFDEAFFDRRVMHALQYRKTVMGDDFSCCRLIFGEADYFPGLTVDRFEDVLVTEVLSLGVELRKGIIYRSLVKRLDEMGAPIKAIYEKNQSPLRDKEGMSQYSGFYCMEGLESDLNGVVEITENGIKYSVDYINGQKTGFFLDQKYNRLAAARLCRDKNVLDCCTHTGAFALNAAKAGASRVTALDVSAQALEKARANSEINGLKDRISFVQADVFEFLSDPQRKKGEFDVIILDPPAFTKSTSTVQNAYKGYKDINLKAMKLLPRGGCLATCSCSHFMIDELFRKILF